jgi:hypothetical protein
VLRDIKEIWDCGIRIADCGLRFADLGWHWAGEKRLGDAEKRRYGDLPFKDLPRNVIPAQAGIQRDGKI